MSDLPLEDTIAFIKEIIERENLQTFYDLTDPKIEDEIEEMAKRILSVPKNVNLAPEIATDLVYLALYDLCILIGTISYSGLFYGYIKLTYRKITPRPWASTNLERASYILATYSKSYSPSTAQ